jgi:hypothetical protein
MNPKVSVTLNTVRGDESFRGRSVLGSIADDLARQTFRDFELVIVDGLHAERAGSLAGRYPFPIVHVPPKQSAMVRARRCAISAYKNTALALARGELVVPLDDGCTIDERFLERCWLAWDKDRVCLSALCDCVHDDGSPRAGAEHYDSRRIYLDESGRCVGPVGGNVMVPPMHGLTAFPLEAALEVNGYDEMFDGSRGLEDMDMGIRLQRAGYRIALSREHRAGLFKQGAWSEHVFGDNGGGDDNPVRDETFVKCSQTTLRVRLDERLAGQVRANDRPWTAAEWSRVAPRCMHLTHDNCCALFTDRKSPCPFVGHCADREHPGLRVLREAPPVFDLRTERLLLERGHIEALKGAAHMRPELRAGLPR